MLPFYSVWPNVGPPVKLICFLLLFTLLAGSASVSAQTVSKISGTVVDSASGEKLSNVSIIIHGTLQGGSSNNQGAFELDISKESVVLQFSRLGYITKTQMVRKGEPAIIKMVANVDELQDVAVVAYGRQKKSSMVSAITTIDPKDLKVPSSNLTTAMAGRLAGVIAYQRTGEPGQDNASFFIRGVTTFGYKKDPLILIDGVEVTPTDLARLQPDDIASFSIMRDATATALFGARGANGVILVTSKSGKEGPAKISVRFENSTSSNTKDIELADPVTYMKLENEAVLTRNRLGILPYSQNKIDNTIAGNNPYIYPANNWMDQLIKKSTTNQRMNFNASGGGRIARYYIAGTYNQDNGILQVEKRNNFNSNVKLKTYQLRSNVNINMTKTTEVIVRLGGTFDDYRGPIDGGRGVYTKIMRSNPVLFPAYYPAEVMPLVKHPLFGNAEGSLFINPYADMVKGYKDYSGSTMNAQVEVKQDLGFMLKGLSARALFNTSRYSYFDVSRAYNPFFYAPGIYDKQANTYSLQLLNENSATEYLNYSEGKKEINTSAYLEAAVNYNTKIGERNDITGMLVFMKRHQLQANQGTLQKSLPYRNQGVSGRFTYAFNRKYLAELNFGYNGSERFYKTQRYGFFPAAGIGYYISNEDFWEPLLPAISRLKLKATYGLVGNDAIGKAEDRFFYLSEVNMNSGERSFITGENFNYLRPGITVNRYNNEDITWERAKSLSVGMELGLFNDFTMNVDYFVQNRDNILMSRSFIPTTMGLSADVRANLGKAQSRGIEIQTTYNKTFGSGIWLQASGNFTYAKNKFTRFEEPQYNEPYKSRIGRSIDQIYGYVAERLFVDEYEVANSPRQNFGEYMAGDIKYRDVNGDGQITELDIVPLGYPTVPEIIYGFGFSTGYKGFDFSVFFQGSARSSFWINPSATSPFAHYRYDYEVNSGALAGNKLSNQLLKAYANDHWSEDNNNLYALWPRLSTSVIGNNAQWNTWFMRNGAFLRLKNIEIGYSLPKKLAARAFLNNARFYVSGVNMLTFSAFKLWDIEMGGDGLQYPIQKVVNAGVLLGF